MIDTIWTVGHSSRTLEEFLGLLAFASIEFLVDVRKLPGSRRYPHFDREPLTESLREVGVGYHHEPALGGRRSQRAVDSPNSAWRVASFNAFADHMESPEFANALDNLAAIARNQRVVIMCSEAVPWQCHRRLISDALLVRNWTVLNIMNSRRLDAHTLTDFARVDGIHITYPAEPLFPTE